MCTKCRYESLVKQVYCLPYEVACCECDETSFANKDQFKYHIRLKHSKSDFRCDIHPRVRTSNICLKCLYQELVQTCKSEEKKSVVALSSSDPKKDLSWYHCFDCDFKTKFKHHFTSHARYNHPQSNFSCSEHTLGDMDVGNCAMCRYKNILVSSNEDALLSCLKCKFKCLDENSLKKHYQHNHSETPTTCQSNTAVVAPIVFVSNKDAVNNCDTVAVKTD